MQLAGADVEGPQITTWREGHRFLLRRVPDETADGDQVTEDDRRGHGLEGFAVHGSSEPLR